MRPNMALAAGAVAGATAGLVCLLLASGPERGPRSDVAIRASAEAARATLPAPEPAPALRGPAAAPSAIARGSRLAPRRAGQATLGTLPAPGPATFAAKTASAPAEPAAPPLAEKTHAPVTDVVDHGISGFHQNVDLSHPVPLAGPQPRVPRDKGQPVSARRHGE